jgi:hypothetical protein
MAHIVKTLVPGISLTDGKFYPSANAVVTLTDAQYAQLSPSVFYDNILLDLGTGTTVSTVPVGLPTTSTQGSGTLSTGNVAAAGTVVTPMTQWTMVHNLGFYPAALCCLDTQGNIMWPSSIDWPDLNTMTAGWSQLESGSWKVS